MFNRHLPVEQLTTFLLDLAMKLHYANHKTSSYMTA